MSNLESVPPHFRHLNQHQPPIPAPDHDDAGGSGNNNSTKFLESLPTIDLEKLNSDDDKNKLDETCKHWGLFRLVNHGIPPTLLRELHEQAKQVFSLPFETKKSSCDGRPGSDNPLNYFLGTASLTPSGATITTDKTQNVNLFEGLGIPAAELSLFQHPLPVFESFRALLVEYENHTSRIATTLFETMLKNLDLDQELSKSYLTDNKGLFRVYRYLHCSNSKAGLGLAVHTDSSALTILNQEDEVNGLEVLRDDEWLTVKPIPNTLIVNIGDLMQAISDDRYKSALHRVRVDKHKDRVSITYFMYTSEDVKVESFKYRPFTSNEYLAQIEQDIKAVGQKIGLSKFKLITAEDN